VKKKQTLIYNLDMHVEDFWSRIRDNLEKIKELEEIIA